MLDRIIKIKPNISTLIIAFVALVFTLIIFTIVIKFIISVIKSVSDKK